MLGLAHPCELGGAPGAPDCTRVSGAAETTMYPLYSAEQATLAADDIAGVCFLYPAADCEGGCPDGSLCSPEGCRPACGDSYCPSNQICDGDRCVPIDSVDAGCGSLGCNPDGRCTTDAQCPPDQRCQNGTCARGRAHLGDPCIESADCAEGTCSADGHCAVRCATNAECERGERCDTTQTPATCTGRGSLGATCSESNQCLGEQCLAGVTDEPICTRLCGPLLTPCPAGWECLAVHTRSVCAPEPELMPAGGGGCQLPNTAPTSRSLALFTLCLTLAVRHRRRSRKEITA
jgi:hypothetical protein